MEVNQKMKYYLEDNKELLMVNPTQFLIEAETNGMWEIGPKDIVSFIDMFDKAGIEFDINKLFSSESFPFINKYFEKGSTQSDIEFRFVDAVLKNPKLKDVVTEIPKEKFQSLSGDEIHKAIKNTILCTKIGTIAWPVDRIYLQLFFDYDKYKIDLCIVAESSTKKLPTIIILKNLEYGFLIMGSVLMKKIYMNN